MNYAEICQIALCLSVIANAGILSTVIAADTGPEYLVTINAADYIEGNIPKSDKRIELNTANPPAPPGTHYFVTYRFNCDKEWSYAIWLVGGGSGHFGKSIYSCSIDGSPFQIASSHGLITPDTNLNAFNDRQIELIPHVRLQPGEHLLTLRVENDQQYSFSQGKYTFTLAQVALAKVWEPRSARLPNRIALHSGDRVFFIGDSISTGGHYIKYVTSAFVRVFPEADIRFYNSDNPGDTTVQGLVRLKRDVLSMNPSWVVLALGINDVRDLTLYSYIRNMKDMLEQIKKSGARVMLLTPTVYDEDPAKEPKDATGYAAEMLNNEAVKYHNLALIDMAAEITNLAKAHSGLVADVWTPFKQLVEWHHNGQNPIDLLPDRLHPIESGHLVMAVAILKGFGITNTEIEQSGLDIPSPLLEVFRLKSISKTEKN